MGSDRGLTVRQFERHDVGLDASVTLTPATAAVLRFSAAGQSMLHAGAIRATLLDVGDGGLGLRTAMLLPRGAVVRVRVQGHGAGDAPALLDTEARVQRVIMSGREPTYQLGMAFTSRGPDLAAQVAAVRAASTPREGARRSA